MAHSRRFSAYVASGRNPRSIITDALRFARCFASESCLEDRARVKTAIVVEELVSNCLHHGGPNRDLALSIELQDTGGAIEICIEDNGRAFDPTQAPEITAPNPQTGGGVGLAIIHAWCGDMDYSRHGNVNTLRLSIT